MFKDGNDLGRIHNLESVPVCCFKLCRFKLPRMPTEEEVCPKSLHLMLKR